MYIEETKKELTKKRINFSTIPYSDGTESIVLLDKGIEMFFLADGSLEDICKAY